MFTMYMRFSKLRSRRPPKLSLAEKSPKSIYVAWRVWWRHGASGPDIVDYAMLNIKIHL
jgi:hypothetical protein